jgi:DNA-binding transcriptional LysR family regulator
MAYAYRARSASWRFTSKDGEEVSIVPNGPLRVNNADALVPAALAGLAICELPEFMAADHVRSGQLQPLLTDWAMATGGVYFVRPSARAKPAKVEALANFLADRLSAPDWQLTERR